MKYPFSFFLLTLFATQLAAAQEADATANNARTPQTIFQDFCFSCHGTGWENAPVVGDAFDWEERREQGIDTLLKHTLEGINAMPAKGACTDCTEEELKKTVEWMIAD